MPSLPSCPPHFLSSFHIFPCPFTRSLPALFSFLLLLSIWTLLFFPPSPLPQKPINLQAEPRAFFLFITRSGHVWLSVSLALTTLCVCLCVRLCVCFCAIARAHLCIRLFLCSLRSTLGQTRLTTAPTLSQTRRPTTGERGAAARVALMSLEEKKSVLVHVVQLRSAPPSLKKSSAELKRILSNGQVSTFSARIQSLPACWHLCLCCLRLYEGRKSEVP